MLFEYIYIKNYWPMAFQTSLAFFSYRKEIIQLHYLFANTRCVLNSLCCSVTIFFCCVIGVSSPNYLRKITFMFDCKPTQKSYNALKKMFCWITSRVLGIFPTCFPVIFPTFHCTKLFTSGRWLYGRYRKHLVQGFISLCFVGVIKPFIFFSGIPKPSCHQEQEDKWLG